MTDRRNGDRRTGKNWKPPSYAHYAKEWLVDTGHLTLEEQGAFQRLLDNQWVNGRLPEPERDRAGMLSVTIVTFRRLWRRIGHYFPDGLNKRLEEIRAEQLEYRAQRSEAGRRSAAARNGTPTTPQRDGHENGNETATDTTTTAQRVG